MVLWSRSNEALHLVAPVTGYVTGKALSDLNAALKTSQEHRYVPAGTDRLFDTKVTQISETTATISTCDDGSQYQTMDLSTGQDLPPPSASQQYLLEIWGMVLMSGHWGISDLTIVTLPDHRAAACQP